MRESVFRSWKSWQFWLVGMSISIESAAAQNGKHDVKQPNRHWIQSRKMILCVKYIFARLSRRPTLQQRMFVALALIHACSTSMTCDAVSRAHHHRHNGFSLPHRRPCADYHSNGKININKRQTKRERPNKKDDGKHTHTEKSSEDEQQKTSN